MKILIVSQYFWPENFRINDMALGLLQRGHEVEVLTGKPNYPQGKFYKGYSFFSKNTENWQGIKIHRSKLVPRGNASGFMLMINYISFAFFSSIKALFLKGNFDCVLVYEPSPITVGIPAIVIKNKNKIPIYFWVQDIWPQSVTAAGGVKNLAILKLLDKLTKWIYYKSDKVLIQSEAFRSILLAQNVNPYKISYYPNSVENFFNVQKPDINLLESLPKGFKIMFAGNIGESQDFETLMETAKIVAKVKPSVKWIILGDGRKKQFVEDKIKLYNLSAQFFLLGSHDVHLMPKYFSCADCLLVSLKKDYIFSLTIPSKIQSYLACGKPILASLNGEGSRIIIEAKAGLVADAELPAVFATKVLQMANLSSNELQIMGENAKAYFNVNFEREMLLTRLEDILTNG